MTLHPVSFTVAKEAAEESPFCGVCGGTEHLRISGFHYGAVCSPCLYIWYDGCGCCERPDHRDRPPHVHGEDILAYRQKALAEGSWPFDSPEFRP